MSEALGENRSLLNARVAQDLLSGKELAHDTSAELRNQGVWPDLMHESIAIGVAEENLSDPLLQEEVLQLFTTASVRPLAFEVLPMAFLDQWLANQEITGKQFAAILAAGNLVPDSLTFALSLMQAVALMQKEQCPLLGHLMNRSGRLPYLHEQFFILDLKMWGAAGRPSFGQPYVWQTRSVIKFKVSPECIHDDYTPLWIQADSELGDVEGRCGFGTEVLSRLVRQGYRVLNVPIHLRKEKKYAYPREGRGSAYHEIKALTRANEEHSKHHVFVFNTEDLVVRDFGLQMQTLIAPCAGLKPFALVRQMGVSAKAIAHFECLLSCRDYEGVLQQLAATLAEQGQLPHSGLKYVDEQMTLILQEAFLGSADVFMSCLKGIAEAACFYQMDYHFDRARLMKILTGNGRVLFWHSNSWNCTNALYRCRPAGLRKNYLELVGHTARQLQTQAWVHDRAFDAVIGNDFSQPEVVFTAGYNRGSSLKSRSAYLPFEFVEPGWTEEIQR
jgi:hypothetical protein